MHIFLQPRTYIYISEPNSLSFFLKSTIFSRRLYIYDTVGSGRIRLCLEDNHRTLALGARISAGRVAPLRAGKEHIRSKHTQYVKRYCCIRSLVSIVEFARDCIYLWYEEHGSQGNTYTCSISQMQKLPAVKCLCRLNYGYIYQGFIQRGWEGEASPQMAQLPTPNFCTHAHTGAYIAIYIYR